MSEPGGYDLLAAIGEAEPFDLEGIGALTDDDIDELCAEGRV